MIRTIAIEKEEPLILLADRVVYRQKMYWGNATARQLSLSFLGPRQSPKNPLPPQPLLIFLCGGSFQKVDRCAWMPELGWFAKAGYSVASVEYSVLPYTKWPEQITEVKAAIRFLRAHAGEFNILPDKVALMGESAGGYLAALAGLTGETRQWDTGEHLEQSSAVQAVIPWYPPVHTSGPQPDNIRVDLTGFLDLTELPAAGAPPFFILHGTKDATVPCSESQALYEALQRQGVQSDLLLLEGARHSDAHFIQAPVKKEILTFLNRHLR